MEQLSLEYEQAPVAPPPGLRLTDEQREAVSRRGEEILLSAAAGSGKTSVLVERFVAAVREDGIAPAAVLAITFTDRAAGELRERVRARLLELGERGAARDTEAASVGTFHAFCGRLLRSHPLPAGLDPDFRVLDATASARLRRSAFEDALVEFVAAGGAAAVDLLAAYNVDLVRSTIDALYAQLRSRGRLHPRLPVRDPAAAEEAEALRTVALYDDLLARFGDRYERLKQRDAAVDFDDLELLAGALLAANPMLRETWAERFELLMVDEFQDTNPRQLAILGALDRGNLFTVGDELQSIYGFRHADVRLFRERRGLLAPAGRALSLRSNFRSRVEVIEAVNTVFERRFEHFTPLVHAREEDPGTAAQGPFVELLVTSPTEEWKGHAAAEAIAAGLPYAPLGRQAEARLLAQRVRELVDSGAARPDEIAVLLRATGDIETFERALQLEGLRTLASVGTFWSRQQIEDLHSYLRALANPRDEEALYATLASPLAGCSRDALALIAEAKRAASSTLWETLAAIREEGGEGLGERDRALLAEFLEWFAAERARAGGRGISELLERAIAQRGYDRYVLALDWAERRLANVHKLLRLARRFEEEEGRDLRAFVDLVAQLKDSGASEPEAPVEGVEPDTVQLMTIHTAKGLEFPVVCVADLGRRPPNPADRLFVDGERVGLRLRRPGEGEGTKTLDYEELRSEQRAREREEEDRVFYVGLTRARDRLLLSGVADFASWPEEKSGTPPINWLGPALCEGLAELGRTGPGVHAVAPEGGAPALRVTLSAPAAYGQVLRAVPSPPSAGPPRSGRERRPACACPRPGGAGGGTGAGARAVAADAQLQLAHPARALRLPLLPRTGAAHARGAARGRGARRRRPAGARARHPRASRAGDEGVRLARAAGRGAHRGGGRRARTGRERRGARGDRHAARRRAREPAGGAHRRLATGAPGAPLRVRPRGRRAAGHRRHRRPLRGGRRDRAGRRLQERPPGAGERPAGHRRTRLRGAAPALRACRAAGGRARGGGGALVPRAPAGARDGALHGR